MLSEACTWFIIASCHLIHFLWCRMCWSVAVKFNIVLVLIWYSMMIVSCIL